MDAFLYSGSMERGSDLKFIKMVSGEKKSDDVTLILCTLGGNPDAAYKIGAYLQARYNSVTVVVPGLCKSAGTLLAIAASELVFSPYGELGPLDVQMSKQDNLVSLESGLNIIEALSTVEDRARETFHTTVAEVISGSGGVVSFATAAQCSAELVESMYAPVFAQIDPEEVGSRSRAMRIGEDYGKRLNRKFENLRNQNSMIALSRSYPSHGFVIDMTEAQHLFKRVREATEAEKNLVDKVEDCCRFPPSQLKIECITDEFAFAGKGVTGDGKTDSASAGEGGSGKPNGGNSSAANGENPVPPGKKHTKASSPKTG
ncbi:MAG: hypothetical protein RID23_13500 [Roseovarius sp.]